MLTKEQQQALTARLEYYKEIMGQVDPAMDALTQAAVEQTQAQRVMNQILEESQEVMAKTKHKAEDLAGSGEGEGGKGGFAGIAANVIKAEKVMSGLASGSGFADMGGMLESITGALGFTGGLAWRWAG